MPSPADLIPGRSHPADFVETQQVEGIVHRAPATLTDSLEVIIPEFDSHRTFRIRRWMPRPSATDPLLPDEGDEALITFAEGSAEPWLTAWWPNA
jgi:hypothetical protein